MRSIFVLLLVLLCVSAGKTKKAEKERVYQNDRLEPESSLVDNFMKTRGAKKLRAREYNIDGKTKLRGGSNLSKKVNLELLEGKWDKMEGQNNIENVKADYRIGKKYRKGKGPLHKPFTGKILIEDHLTNQVPTIEKYLKTESSKYLKKQQDDNLTVRPKESEDFKRLMSISEQIAGGWKLDQGENNGLNEAAVGEKRSPEASGKKTRKGAMHKKTTHKKRDPADRPSLLSLYDRLPSTKNLKKYDKNAEKQINLFASLKKNKKMPHMRQAEGFWSQMGGNNNGANEESVGDSSGSGINNNLFLAVCLLASLGAGYYVGKRQSEKAAKNKYEILDNQNPDKGIEMSYQTASAE